MAMTARKQRAPGVCWEGCKERHPPPPPCPPPPPLCLAASSFPPCCAPQDESTRYIGVVPVTCTVRTGP